MSFYLRWPIKKAPPPVQKEAAIQREWDENAHPRGKTTQNTNDGSFTHASGVGPGGDSATNIYREKPNKGTIDYRRQRQAPAVKPQNGKVQPDSGKVLRRSMEKAPPELDAAVAGAENPAEVLNDQYGPIPSFEEAMSQFPPDQVKKAQELIDEADRFIRENGDTWQNASIPDPLDPTRRIPTPETEARWARVFAEETKNWEDFLPPEGKAPTLTFIGGRGGSGKSSFATKTSRGEGLGVYDETKAYVVDPDKLKTMIPGYDGNKAKIYHEESSEMSKRLVAMARARGINVVIDKTLASDKTRVVQSFMDKGYKVKAVYMHVPVVTNLQRVFSRWRDSFYAGKTPRLVPFAEVLKSKSNEKNFTAISRMKGVEWTLYSGDVPSNKLARKMASGVGTGESTGNKKGGRT